MNWIRLAVLSGVVIAAAVVAAIRWPGEIAVDVIIPLTPNRPLSRLVVSAMTAQRTIPPLLDEQPVAVNAPRGMRANIAGRSRCTKARSASCAPI